DTLCRGPPLVRPPQTLLQNTFRRANESAAAFAADIRVAFFGCKTSAREFASRKWPLQRARDQRPANGRLRSEASPAGLALAPFGVVVSPNRSSTHVLSAAHPARCPPARHAGGGRGADFSRRSTRRDGAAARHGPEHPVPRL